VSGALERLAVFEGAGVPVLLGVSAPFDPFERFDAFGLRAAVDGVELGAAAPFDDDEAGEAGVAIVLMNS
jgi:hypothetical protein